MATSALRNAKRRGDVLEEVVVKDDFIAPDQVRELRQCAEARRNRGEFRAAAIGAERAHRSEIRGDSTCWLEEPLHAAERSLLTALDAVRLEWNQRAFLGLFDLEAHYASYAPGAAYARHVDQVRGGAPRLLSLVLYLNAEWPETAGGALRLFSDAVPPWDIVPLGGRLVSFVTAGREHEVLAATQTRLSISGWYRGRG